jgi:hypothetical protein
MNWSVQYGIHELQTWIDSAQLIADCQCPAYNRFATSFIVGEYKCHADVRQVFTYILMLLALLLYVLVLPQLVVFRVLKLFIYVSNPQG